MTEWLTASDWLQASGHPIVGRGFRPTQQHKRATLAAKALRALKVREAKLRREQALRQIVTEVWVKAPVSKPRAKRAQRVRTAALSMAEYALADGRQRALSNRVVQRFHKSP
jgi:hypothetical protein